MPTRRYCLAEARGIIAARLEEEGHAFTETEWLLSVLKAIPDFATRQGHHLEETELNAVEKEVRNCINNR